MKNKDLKFLEKNLNELVKNDIITQEQYNDAYDFFNVAKDKKSVSVIFSSIGLLLIGLSIITLFSINWNIISREFKCIIAFIPLIITSIMLYHSMKNENKILNVYTSIVAPISILATNSLIGQTFQLQFNFKSLLFASLLMSMPITFIIKNYISLIIYGVGVVLYSVFNDQYFNIFVLSLPLILYNLYNYIKNKDDNVNIVLWIFNIIIISVLLFANEIIRPEILLIYLYNINLIAKLLYKKDNICSKALSFIFMFMLFINCITSDYIFSASNIEVGIDNIIGLFISIGLFILSHEYKNVDEYCILLFVLLHNLAFWNFGLIFILFNLIVLSLGIYKILNGYKINSNKTIRKGIATILYIIFVRFMSAEISFKVKSILFLVLGIIFIFGSIKFNRKGDKDETK